jgi:ABC-type branched-subunit amino acid transport system substrate-binding protein
MKFFKSKLLLATLLSSLFCKPGWSQIDSSGTQTVNATILLPLYLDSLFKTAGYTFNNAIPRFALPALEFYNGVQLAVDSLNQEGIKARIEIVDSRKSRAVSQVFNTYSLHKPGLVIGVVQSSTELKQVADLALQNKVPFISATYPNDGGITANPSLVIANSTLKTHCNGIYKYLQTRHDKENLVLFYRKNASVGDRIKQYLNEAQAASDKKLNWKMVPLTDSFSISQVGYYLDSLQSNVIVGASMNDDFSMRLIKSLSALKSKYRSAIFGMPTWDEYNLTKPEFRGVDVYYSTPFVSYSANASLYNAFVKKYKTTQNSKPSDMVFRGFEITYRYVKTLAQNPDSFIEHVNDSRNKVFADFRFEPVHILKDGETPDYWENKKLYFVKKTDGLVKGVY